MKIWKLVFWIVIIAITFFSRFYKLVQFPPGLTIDEVSIGYNAFSILKTGKDEWGKFLPISFKSVGDYKAPTLIYLTVPFVKLLGLNEISTRLPVALFSAFNIYLLWLFVRRYIFNKKYFFLSYLATFIFSLSPWLTVYSRSGFEAIIALTFLLINLIFAFEYRKTGRLIYFVFMFIFAYLSAITYHSTKIVVPLLNIIFVLTDYKYFLNCVVSWNSKNKLLLLASAFLFIAITLFFIDNFVFGLGASRASMTFLTKDFDYARGMLPTFVAHPLSSLTSAIGLISFWFKRCLEYFSANFYLSSGLGLTTFNHPGQGVIFAIEYPFLITGFFILLSTQKYFDSAISKKFVSNILIFWFFLTLLPASITNNSQHSLRTLNIVPVVSILITIGLVFIFELIKKKYLRYLFGAIIFIGYIVGVVRFIDYYTLHYPVELSETRSFGWKQVAIYARDHHTEYDDVYVDPRFGTVGPYTYGVPYMYFLFYSRYDPEIYANDPRRQEGRTDFENYLFTPINWWGIDHSNNNLYIASPWSFPEELQNSDKQKYYVEFLNRASGLYVISDK